MKKRLLSLLLSLVMVMGLLPASALAAGTVSVASADELKAQLAANADIVLAGDLDLAGWTTHETEFTGTLDGAGHSITGLVHDKASGRTGMLLSTIGKAGVVKNLTIKDASVENTGERVNVGVLAGLNEGTVENVHIQNAGIYGGKFSNVGGIVGLNKGTVSQCSNLGGGQGVYKARGGQAGGIVGRNNGGLVDQCFNVDAVSSASGAMHGEGFAGGIAGSNGELGTVSHSYNRGKISKGTMNSGGIVGSNTSVDGGSDGLCINTFHAGVVEGGGNNVVTTCYGYVSNNWYDDTNSGVGHVGKGDQYSPENAELAAALNIHSDFFVIDGGRLKLTWETGRQPAAAERADKTELNNTLMGASGLTQQSGPYTDASWLTFLDAQNNAKLANAYPYATAEQVTKVTTALNAAYSGLQKEEASKPDAGLTWTEVGTADALKAALVIGGGIKLTADIMLDAKWDSGEPKAFTLDGQGHTITLGGTPLLAAANSYGGKDSVLAQGSTVQNVIFAGKVNGNELNSSNGAVAGNVQGIVHNCINLAAVTVKGMFSAGGFAGNLTGTIENCVSYGVVTGADGNNGALAGKNNGTITNSYGADQLATAEQQNAAVEALNAALAEGDQQWKLADGKLTFGTAETPEPEKPEVQWTEVADADDLKTALTAGGNIKLTADVTLPADWLIASYKDFVLDGAGHAITLSGRSLIAVDFLGFATESIMNENCTVQNTVFKGEVKGSSMNGFTGAVAGSVNGTIRNCINLAAVKVTGASNAGGIAGDNRGTIENCVGYGVVSGANTNNGAIAGTGVEALKNCYGADDLASAEQQNAALAALNASVTAGDQKWKLADGKLAFDAGTEPENPDVPSVEVIEIADEAQFYAALADLTEDFLMETQKGKKLVITADFTVNAPANRFPPRGLNTVLDGQGHTITLTGTQTLIDEIGADGVVMNLGVRGSIKGNGAGAITNKSAGKIVNCWSSVKINRTDAGAIGGLVGKLEATGTIENCYVAVEAKGLLAKAPQAATGDIRRLVGPLVGNAYEGAVIKNSYWAENMAEDGKQVATPYFAYLNEFNEAVSYEAPGCSVKTLDAMKQADFLALLNANKGSGYSWVAGADGFPVHGEAAPQPTVSKDALKAQIDAADKLTADKYTTETWTVFAKALADAKTVYEDAQADQKAVDAALNQLTQAQEKLAEKPAVQIVEIANAEQFYGALVEVWEPGKVPAQDGKKLVITADFKLPYESFRLPKGLNTVLDGQGHTITLEKMCLLDEIGPKGIVMNLGVVGSAEGSNTGAITPNCSGKIVNCWSTAKVNNNEGSKTIGGLVGTLHETGAIENCYVAADLLKGKNVGAMVGTVRPGSTITNCYWLTGAAENVYFRALDDMNIPVDYAGAAGCSVKTMDELKSADFLALLNANRGENMQWNRSESGLPYFGENVVPVEVIEIANTEQFNAAMSDVWMNESMTDHAGKKFVITADFTYTGTGMPEGLNTVLDGQGHTITLDKSMLLSQIGPDGVIMNLGLIGITGSNDKGAFADNCSGKIVNCWSNASVKNDSAGTIGGFVGILQETGAIENCYVAADLLKGKNVGALVGTVRPGSTITNCYWKTGNGEKCYFRAQDADTIPFDYTGATGCAVKTDVELKSPEFLALLNANRGTYAQWTTGNEGYPHLGEASSVDPTKGIEITLTYANGETPVVFNSAEGLNLTTLDILGMEIKLGTLSCENGAHWSIDYDTYGKDIMIGDSNGELYIYKPSTTKISVANSAWEKLATFTVTITESKAHALRMTASQGEMVNGVLTVPGRTTIHFVPEIQESEGGTWKAANPAMFEFNAPLENAEVVGSSVSPIKPGKFAVTVKGMGQTATQEVESTYAPITSIKPAPSGEFIIHGRQAMVFEKKADFLDLNLSHQTGTVLIEPAYATNQGKNAYNFSFSNPEVADYMADFVMGIRPLRAGTTDITVTTLLEEKNVSGTTQVTFKYKNPLTSIEYPAEVFEVKNGIKIDLPLVLHSELENEGWHVTEPEIDWTFESSDGGKVIIARDGQSVQSSLDSVEGGLWYASDHFTIEGISAGTVKVTGTPWDTTGGAKPFTFTVKVTGEGGPAVDYVQMAKDDTKIAGDWIIKNQNGVYGYNSEWEIFSLLRNGRTVAEAGIDAEAYLDNVAAAIQNPENAKIMKKPTEMARIILAVTVLGKDATDVRGIDLIDRITKSKDADMKVGSNESVWTLIALDTVDYKVPDGAKWTREALLDQILTFEVPTGGFGLFSNEKAGIDTTGMAIQALAPYYNTNAAVKAAVDKSVDYLRNAKDENCGYGNSESTAQVLTALAALRIDPLNASNGFTVGRKNLITNLDSYKTADGGFAHMTNAGSNGMAAYQTLYALEAFLRFHDYKAPLYDLSDIGSEGPVEPVDPAVDAVINKIAAIGKVTLQSEAAIKAARDAFNALNAEQQKLVTNLGVLAAAEKRLEELKNEGGGGITPPAEDITVTFRLIGAKKASEDVDFANGKTTASTGADYQNWIKTRSYTIPKDSTVYDVFTEALDRAGLAFKIRDKNNYVYSIQAPQALGGEMLEEFTNGYFSGWMYTLNGKHSSFGLSEQKLSDGDVVVWHYVNDFRYEVEDWFEGSSGDASTWIDVDSIPDTDPTEQSGGGSSIPTEKPEEDTRTETRPDGTVVETTTRSDGSSTVVETRKDGTVTTTDVTANGDKSVEVRKPDGSSTTNVEMKNGAVSTTTVDKDGRTEAQVKVPQKVFEQAAKDNKPVVLPMPAVSAAQDQSKAPVIKLDAGKAENIMVKVPVANLTAGTVAVVVHADGTEEIIRKTASDKDGILVPLESGAVIKVVDNARKFDDAIPAWSQEAVDFVTSRDLFNGTGASTFSPNASMSRAMLATVLWRLENEAKSTAPASFRDVADGQWYTEAVNWAAEHKIVNGYGDNFAPNDSITRQQLATMMYRYADMLGLDMKADKDTTGFSDHDQVADWAADAMNWAVSVGLMNGKGNNQLDPAGTATRAEVAIMCQRMVNLLAR